MTPACPTRLFTMYSDQTFNWRGTRRSRERKRERKRHGEAKKERERERERKGHGEAEKEREREKGTRRSRERKKEREKGRNVERRSTDGQKDEGREGRVRGKEGQRCLKAIKADTVP